MLKKELLLYLCKQTAEIPWGYDPKIYSVRSLSESLGESQYRIRKLVKELEADGLVQKDHDGGIDEDGYPHCYHGWSITQKAYRSRMYKKCYKEALKDFEQFCEKCNMEWKQKEAEKR